MSFGLRSEGSYAIPPMGDALSQSCGKHGHIRRKSVNATMMPATERVEISTARTFKDDNRITSSRFQSDLERETGALVNVGEVQGPNARFICTDAVEGIEK
jgi:hypothetical protein